MAYCTNPDCQAPENPNTSQYCHTCGTSLLLRNRYRILKPLGEGGFGKTFIAEDIDKLNELCVVKQLIAQAQGTEAKRKILELFKREAQQLQKLQKNEQIPDLQAYFEERGQFFLVQEFIRGQTLTQELSKKKHQFSEAEVIQLFQEVLPVLQFIHAAGIIHRDLKPDNLMRRQDDGRLVVIDFGISKELKTNTFTAASVMAGSWGYAPPEQMQEGGSVGPATDLYALGVIGFHLLSGVNPWLLWQQQGYSWTERWPEYLKTTISPGLSAVLFRLLAADLQSRYRQAQEVIQDLQKSLSLPTQSSVPQPLPPLPLASSTSPPQVVSPSSKRPWLMGGIVAGVLGISAIALWLIPAQLSSEDPIPTPSSAPGAAPTSSAQQPSDQAKQYLNAGNEKFRQGKFSEAIADYTQAIESSPEFAIAYNNRGSSYKKLGQLQPAIADYNKAIELYPDYSEAYDNRGSAKGSLGDYDSAITDHQKAIALNPNNASAHFNLGNGKLRQGKRQEALVDYDRAIELNPKFTNAYNNRGRVRDTLGDHEGAIADYDKALELDSNNSALYTNRGTAKQGLGDFAGAIADHNRAIQLDPTDYLAYSNRGAVKLKQKQFEAAIADFDQSLQRNPEYASAYSNRGGAKLALGNQQGAIADYDQAIRLNPNDGNAYFNRAGVKSQLGQTASALEDYRNAASLYQQQGRTADYDDAQRQISQLGG